MANLISYPNTQAGVGGTEYPIHAIDPMKKGYDWILAYVRAANAEGQSYLPNLLGSWYYRRMEEIRSYAMGKQTINKYKRRQPNDEIQNQAQVNNDYTVVPIICRFREIIIARLLQRQYEINAYAIDPLSKSKEDTIYNEMKVKIKMREMAQQAGSPLANSPLLKQREGEPEDLGELNINMEFGYKDTMTQEAEEGIQLIQQQNQIEEKRRRTIENLVDYGLGGYHESIDENGQCKLEDVPIKNLLVSFCTKNDFSDMVHWGVYEDVNLIDLAPYFTPEQMDLIQTQVAGKNNNPRLGANGFKRAWAKHKVAVLNFKFLTWDTTVYKSEIDNRGNERFGKTHYENIQFVTGGQSIEIVDEESKGGQTPIYSSVTKQNLYKCKWIVDTDMMYDWGISENQVRKKSSWWNTSLDCQLYAWNFDNMMFTGITERLIPIADAYYLTWQKLQNLKNKLIPYLIEIDLSAVENAVFGAGGEKMTREQIMDLAFSNFIVMSRSEDLIAARNNPNYKSVQIHASGQLQAFVHLYEDLQFCISQLYDLTGLNQITAASTPNAKTLVPGYENANIGTDNAIYLLAVADRNLMLRMSDAIMCKIQIAVKLGKVEGYLKPLGSETIKFLSINPDLSLWEQGLFLDDAPNQQQKDLFYQELTAKESQGQITPADKLLVMGCRNFKQAQRYLAYIIDKRSKENHQRQMELVQQQTQGNAQAGIQIEQAKQQTMLLQGKIDLELENVKGQWAYSIELAKKASDRAEAEIQADAKKLAASITAEAKILSQHISAEASKEKIKSKTA